MPLFEHFPYTNFHDLNLDQIAKKIEELESLKQAIAEVNALAVELRSEMDVLKEQMTDLESLYNGFADQIQQEFNDLTASLNDKFDLLKNDVQDQIDGFQGEIDGLQVEIDGLQGEIDDLEETLAHVLNNLPSEIEMLNPYTGEMDSLDNIINYLANAGKNDSLTASEYDALTLTATAYDTAGLTAYQYDWNGKSLLS